MNEWMNEWMNDKRDVRMQLMNGVMNEWMKEGRNERMNEWQKGRTDAINEWRNEWRKQGRKERIEWMNNKRDVRMQLMNGVMKEWINKSIEKTRHLIMTKPLHPQKNQKCNVTAQKCHQNAIYKTIVDRLRTVSWSSDSHPTGVVKPIYGTPAFPLTAKAVLLKGHTFKN